jgi:5'-nucleotidase
MSNRRSFLKNTTLVATATLLTKPISSFANLSKTAATLHASGKNVIIYYSSQLNGQIREDSKESGGINNLNKLLNNQDTGGLILDAGNFLGPDQDPNHHYAVIEAMNKTGYHTSMPSPQDLSYGENYLAKLSDTMNFCLVNCNYVFNDLKLTAAIKPWQIINFGKFKIGITGVGPEINGIGFHDPVKKANDTAQHLKNKMDCDFVVCLSSLDYQKKGNTTDNITLAEQSEAIDLIIGSGIAHKKNQTIVLKNAIEHDVFIGHPVPQGLTMGKLVFRFKDQQKYSAENRHLANMTDKTC